MANETKHNSTEVNEQASTFVSGATFDHAQFDNAEFDVPADNINSPYENETKRSGRPWRFEDLRARVDVDFNADPKMLVEADSNGNEPPFRFICSISYRAASPSCSP